jgi:hypothetical protein
MEQRGAIVTTYAQAEALAAQIIDTFAADMQRAPNACACCGHRVTWPCSMGAWHIGGGQLVLYPLCEGCTVRAQAAAAGAAGGRDAGEGVCTARTGG